MTRRTTKSTKTKSQPGRSPSLLAVHLARAAMHGGVAQEVLALLSGDGLNGPTDGVAEGAPSGTLEASAASAAPATKETTPWGDGKEGLEYSGPTKKYEMEKPDSELSSLIKQVADRLSSNTQGGKPTNS